MAIWRSPKPIDLDDLRTSFIVYEIRRVKNASRAMTAIGILTLFFLGVMAVKGFPRLEWQLIALLGLSSFCVAFPLVNKFDLSKSGTGLETRDPVALIQAIQTRTEEVSGESFVQIRRQIGALSVQLSELSGQLTGEEAGIAKSGKRPHGSLAPEAGADEEGELSLRSIRSQLPPITVPDDPQKGRFGGDEARAGRMLAAQVEESPLGKDWMKLKLKVSSTNGHPLIGKYIYFFLHDTYQPDVYRVKLGGDGMSASLEIPAYGAYTVGACADRGATLLELDMATSPNLDAPEEWRVR